jgi:hypothetical protein
MPKKQTDDAPRQLTPAEIVPEVLRVLDQISEERAALTERKRAQYSRLYDECGFSKTAVKAFERRRELDEEGRMQFDRDLATLCSAVGDAFQPDMFDQLAMRDMRDAHIDGDRAH